MDVRSCKLPSFISDVFYWGPAGMRRPVPRNGTDRRNREAACSHGKEGDGLWGYGFGKPTGRQIKTLPERCVLQQFREILIKYRIVFLAGGGGALVALDSFRAVPALDAPCRDRLLPGWKTAGKAVAVQS